MIYFGIYRLDDRHLRGSMTSDLKLPPESETDSIADYVDGENTGMFNINNLSSELTFFGDSDKSFAP